MHVNLFQYVFIQGVLKLDKTLEMDSSCRGTKEKWYDSMGPEMYGYRVREL
jgi:hypothetical protein